MFEDGDWGGGGAPGGGGGEGCDGDVAGEGLQACSADYGDVYWVWERGGG